MQVVGHVLARHETIFIETIKQGVDHNHHWETTIIMGNRLECFFNHH
jgi:hypothetical protein